MTRILKGIGTCVLDMDGDLLCFVSADERAAIADLGASSFVGNGPFVVLGRESDLGKGVVSLLGVLVSVEVEVEVAKGRHEDMVVWEDDELLDDVDCYLGSSLGILALIEASVDDDLPRSDAPSNNQVALEVVVLNGFPGVRSGNLGVLNGNELCNVLRLLNAPFKTKAFQS